MKSLSQLKLASLTVGIALVAIHWSFILAEDYGLEQDLDQEGDSSFEFQVNSKRLRELSPEEEELANEARAHIAQTIENNLVRLMAVISARGNGRQPRQDDDDEDIASVTPNPNVLPQVAQILGAIFSGSLNITRVVDQTFGLVPNIVRNQVGGLVKLLTGENMEEAASTTVAPASAPPPPQVEAVTGPPAPVVIHVRLTDRPEAKPAETKASSGGGDGTGAVIVEPSKLEEVTEDKVAAVQNSNNSTSKGKYKVRSRTKGSTSTTAKSLLEDDEIEKLEDDIRRAARAYEPYLRGKEPRGFIDDFRKVFGRVDFNMTDINRAVPTIFKGARRAFQVLDNLGILDANTFLEEFGLGPLYQEREEEEEEE